MIITVWWSTSEKKRHQKLLKEPETKKAGSSHEPSEATPLGEQDKQPQSVGPESSTKQVLQTSILPCMSDSESRGSAKNTS